MIYLKKNYAYEKEKRHILLFTRSFITSRKYFTYIFNRLERYIDLTLTVLYKIVIFLKNAIYLDRRYFANQKGPSVTHRRNV